MAQNESLDIACQPPVSATAHVLIQGLAPEQLICQWPNAARELPNGAIETRFDLAIFVDPLANGELLAAEQTLAAARDRWAKQVLVLVPLESNTHAIEQNFFSMGFTRRPMPDSLKQSFISYGFSISHYKSTPDWLNAKFWANPERWGKR